MAEASKTKPANIIAIIAFIVMVAVAVWSGIQIVKFAPRIFAGYSISNLFKGEPQISLKLDKANIKAKEELRLSWDLTGRVNGGTISFLYKCENGVVFDIYDDLSKSYKTLPCNTPFNMPLSSKSLKIKAHSSDKNIQDVALAIVYTNNNGEKYKDIKKISIENPSVEQDMTDDTESVAASNTTQNTSDTHTQSNAGNSNKPVNVSTSVSNSEQCKSKIYGKPDLSIHHLRIGSTINGYFVEKRTFYEGEAITIKFTISNYGTKTSPAWYFQALLPDRNGNIYTSQAQPSIAPCSGRYYTLKVQNPAKGASKIIINLDPHNLIKELNEINNNESASVTVY